jgi:hypothetical protein
MIWDLVVISASRIISVPLEFMPTHSCDVDMLFVDLIR